VNPVASSKETSYGDKGKSSLVKLGEDHGRCEELGSEDVFHVKTSIQVDPHGNMHIMYVSAIG
jgi:hypothetical protein